MKSYRERLESVDKENFQDFALELFQFQAKNNPVYNNYISETGIYPGSVTSLEKIPFLPVNIFKYQPVKTDEWKEEVIFESSGTTGNGVSRHYIRDIGLYDWNSMNIFTSFYGDPADYIILALLPSYMERKHSSLVHMVANLIRKTGSVDSGFYLNDLSALNRKITELRGKHVKKIILWGVTFALIDFAKRYPVDLSGWIIIETGGMKGRQEEWARTEVHDFLRMNFNVDNIHSEYGMTELMSQAYSFKEGKFITPGGMQVLIREINDPFSIDNTLNQGVINLIDLANFNSCAFIATEDLGRINADGTFEIIGRMDNSDLRGCNLLLN